jgi:hypothetical protein
MSGRFRSEICAASLLRTTPSALVSSERRDPSCCPLFPYGLETNTKSEYVRGLTARDGPVTWRIKHIASRAPHERQRAGLVRTRERGSCSRACSRNECLSRASCQNIRMSSTADGCMLLLIWRFQQDTSARRARHEVPGSGTMIGQVLRKIRPVTKFYCSRFVGGEETACVSRRRVTLASSWARATQIWRELCPRCPRVS